MNKNLKSVLTLTIIGIVCALILSGVYLLTSGPVKVDPKNYYDVVGETAETSVSSFYSIDIKKTKDIESVVLVKSENQDLNDAVIIVANGYGWAKGKISIMFAIDTNHSVIGVKFISQEAQDRPGTALTETELNKFIGVSSSSSKATLDGIASSTSVSTKGGVIESALNAFDYYNNNKNSIRAVEVE